MKAAVAWAFVTLAGCASMHGPLDVITPDELTIGHGKTSGLMNGGYTGHNDMFEYEGESDSTYAALTWDIPSFQDESLSRSEWEATREANLAADEELAEGGFTLVDGATPPPAWLPFVLGGVGLVIVIGFALFGRSKDPWS